MAELIFPRPFAIAIDDMGWIQGQNDGEDGYGPFRIGLRRRITIDDYKAVVDLAKNVNVRLQGLFIMSEMDRDNILGSYPHTTHMRSDWNNTPNISDLQIQIMDYVKKNSSHLEFGLHGVGHEYWPADGVRKRAEWYNTEDNHPWPEEHIREHLECFVKLMAQYGLSRKNGHSFPETFVPCAYSYYWNPEGEGYSLGEVAREYGVRFANTDFSQVPENNPPSDQNGADFDQGVHVMNRVNFGNLWDEAGKLPTVPIEDQYTDYIETHWANLLSEDQSNQAEVTNRWIAYFQEVQSAEDRYCSKNTEQHHSQWLYKRYTDIHQIKHGLVELDNTGMPTSIYGNFLPSNLVLKIKLKKGEHISFAQLNGKTIPAYFETRGYGLLFLPPLDSMKYELAYEVGHQLIKDLIWHDGTSCIHEIKKKNNTVIIDLCAHGRQIIKFINAKVPDSIISNNPGIAILSWEVSNNMLQIELVAHDIQGEIGRIEITY